MMRLGGSRETITGHVKIYMGKQIKLDGSESLYDREAAGGTSITLSVQRSEELRRIFKTLTRENSNKRLFCPKERYLFRQTRLKWFYLCLKFNFLTNNGHMVMLDIKDKHYVLQGYLGKKFCDTWEDLVNIVVEQESFKPNWEESLYDLITDPREFSEEKILLLLFLNDSNEEQMATLKDLPVPYLYKVLS